MDRLDPVLLAQKQLENDRERTKHFPDLLARKLVRMSASPLGFLRGSAPLFYELLRTREDLRAGPKGEGWLVGDAHLENFGAYQPEPHELSAQAATAHSLHPPSMVPPPRPKVRSTKTAKSSAKTKSEKPKKSVEARFHLNDFDEAFIGPWRIDLLRLTTSLILGGRELGADGMRTLELCDRLLEAHTQAAFFSAPLPPQPRPVAILIEQCRARTRQALLDARTMLSGGKRRFVRGPRYRDLPREVAKAVPEAMLKYAKTLPVRDRPRPEQLEVIDSAHRIAGTGSLGALRIAVLVRGKGGVDGSWIFDMKEGMAPSAARGLDPKTELEPAARVVAGYRACLSRPPRMLGTTSIGHRTMSVRRLAPQEDKLNLRQLRDVDLDSLAAYLGALLGAAHVRGAAVAGTAEGHRVPWSRDEREAMLDRAIAMAGIHETVYLALCKLAR